jgi:uncharacterized phage-associated protein
MAWIKFAFSESKALAALAFVASERPGLTPFYVAKVFYVAEKRHVNRYGRPIVADTYVAMTEGPVPSTIKNYIDENWHWVSQPEGVIEAFTVRRGQGLPKLMPGSREPRLEYLSDSDKECLLEAIAFCDGKSPDELSFLTHLDKAWSNAAVNQPMDYADFVDDDNPHRAEILETLEESAAHAVL